MPHLNPRSGERDRDTPTPRRRLRRLARWFVSATAVAAVLFAVVMGIAFATTGDSYWSRVITWRDAGVDDWRNFPSRPVPNDPAHVSELQRALPAGQSWPGAAMSALVGADQSSFEETLARSGTTAFLIVRGDEIVYERYLNGYTANQR